MLDNRRFKMMKYTFGKFIQQTIRPEDKLAVRWSLDSSRMDALKQRAVGNCDSLHCRYLVAPV